MRRHNKYTLVAVCTAVTLFSSLIAGNLSMTYVQSAMTAIDWEGINDVDGNGALTFSSLGETQNATLRVLCNSTDGYQVVFHSNNATSPTAGELKKGTDGIPYTASLDTSGISSATIATSNLVLNNPGTSSVNVNFNASGNQLPLDGVSQANRIALSLTLASYDGTLYPQGTYTDVITATVSLN